MSYFSQSKSGDSRGATKSADIGAAGPRLDAPAHKTSPSQEIVSTLGPGLLITGNVTSTGAVQVFGRIIGDIHAARLLICKGAVVEGKVVAQEAVIEGHFKGTIHGNNVKLQATAVVDGEIFKQSLVIEQNAQFEGVSRRLEKAVEAPTADQVSGASINHARAPIAALVPDAEPAEQSYAVNGNGGVPAGQSY
ncbi:MAG: polymer-forming cytoskeletal protein [Pseudolabrys sp.]|nr:polymer-forming cytoskeletal protein [Pseudolabrys sp.]